MTEEEYRADTQRIHAVLQKITYKSSTGIKAMNAPPLGVLVQVVSRAQDKDADNKVMLNGPKGFIMVGESEDKIVMEVHQLFQWWEMHECSEHFFYDGKRVYDPHRIGQNR